MHFPSHFPQSPSAPSTMKCATSFRLTVHPPISPSFTLYGSFPLFGLSHLQSPSTNRAGLITTIDFTDPASGNPSCHPLPRIPSSTSASSASQGHPAQCATTRSMPTLSLWGKARRYPYRGFSGRGRLACDFLVRPVDEIVIILGWLGGRVETTFKKE